MTMNDAKVCSPKRRKRAGISAPKKQETERIFSWHVTKCDFWILAPLFCFGFFSMERGSSFSAWANKNEIATWDITSASNRPSFALTCAVTCCIFSKTFNTCPRRNFKSSCANFARCSCVQKWRHNNWRGNMYLQMMYYEITKTDQLLRKLTNVVRPKFSFNQRFSHKGQVLSCPRAQPRGGWQVRGG